MGPGDVSLEKDQADRAIKWFANYFNGNVVGPITTHFPAWALPKEIEDVRSGIEQIHRVFSGNIGNLPLSDWLQRLPPQHAGLFKRMVLLYRRHRAAETERLVEKTFHPELTEKIEAERKALDALTGAAMFLEIPEPRLPRLKDFFPVQIVESVSVNQAPFAARQFDEKFRILQSPRLFLQDLAYFREKCEDRETALAIGFVDIDNFKALNTKHGHSKVDRNVLPRFMQAIEAHLFQHGYAYRQGGEEYLLLLPSLSRSLTIQFLDELRLKLAGLAYPDISEKTTVSIGLCVAMPDCPFTDQELRERANRAEQFAKENGKNCIATYRGPRFVDEELEMAKL